MRCLFGCARGLSLAALIALTSAPAQALMLGHIGHGVQLCLIETGTYPVGFKAYVLAEGKGNPYEPLHGYCDEIPDTGPMTLSVDLVDPTTREMPMAIRLVRADDSDQEVMSIAPKQHLNGIATFQTTIEHPGKYALLLSFDKGSGEPGKVRVPFEVGVGSAGGSHMGHAGRWLKYIGGGLLLIAAGAGALYFRQKRKTPSNTTVQPDTVQ